MHACMHACMKAYVPIHAGVRTYSLLRRLYLPELLRFDFYFRLWVLRVGALIGLRGLKA